MKLLVLGIGGMAGHIIALRLIELGHDVSGVARRHFSFFCNTIIADVMSADLSQIVSKYDAVINCIGILNTAVDKSIDSGIWLNAYLPHLLTRHTKRVIHLSTDCVFSGQEGGGYTENSICSADTRYGRSKALGEIKDDRNLTFRTSIVGPDVNENGIGLFNWYMKQKNSINGYSNVIWSGITTLTLANAIHAALEQNLTGLYHLVNNEAISKYHLLELFGTLPYEAPRVIKSNAVHENKSLVNTRTDFGFIIPSYAFMVEEMGEWIRTHRKLYPQYTLKENGKD